MCGIFGLMESSSSGLFSSDVKIIWGLSLLTSMRGADATGLIGVDVKKNQVDYMKATGGPWEWNSWKMADEFNKRIVSRYNVVIGHGRAATIGKNIAPNAHPFRHGNITLVHNGTLRNFAHLKNRHKLDFDVDSEAVCFLMNKLGLQETIDEIEGAFALAWWDAKEQTANFIRNSERPLSYAVSTNNRRLILASEAATVGYAAYSHKTDKFKEVKEVPTWKHFKITCKGGYNTDIEIVETNVTKKYVSTPSYTPGKGHSHHAGYGGYWESDLSDYSYTPTQTQTTTKIPTATEQKVIICTGEDLEFELLDYDQLESIQDGQKVIVLRGKIPNSKAKVEVIAKYYKGNDALISFLEKKETKPMFRGVVQELRLLDVEQFTTRVFLDKAVEVEEEEQKTTVDNPNAMLELAQGKKISFYQWSHISKKGCAQCGKELSIMKSNKMVRVSSVLEGNTLQEGIMCEDCSDIHLKLKDASDGEETLAMC